MMGNHGCRRHISICMIHDARRKDPTSFSYLMSPNFLVMALPRVVKAAEVFCPAVESVSDVFLKLRHKERRIQSLSLIQYSYMHEPGTDGTNGIIRSKGLSVIWPDIMIVPVNLC